MKPRSSAWERRGFEYSLRWKAFEQFLRANRIGWPINDYKLAAGIANHLCRRNPRLSLTEAYRVSRAFVLAAFDQEEGTADYGRRHGQPSPLQD